ncbi:MAG: enoyl-CoA hydratase [Desulfobacteraceae bacterium]|nr:MAG: enoyl-CoA hydratase [Desulfobacteraceae bacterium]
MTEKDLLYAVRDRVAHITINREKFRNSISAQAVGLFREYLDQAEKDDAVRVVCITGAGEKAFCSGADLGSAIIAEGGSKNQAFQNYANLLKRLAGYPKPTVARVNGYCLAGGTGFMLACDIVIARNDAKFGTPEVNVGLFPMMIGALIFRNVLKKKAMEMVLLGEKLSADQAREMGLITRAVSPEKLDETVDTILDNLAAKSPIGMKIGKQAFYAIQDMGFEDGLDFLCEKLSEVAATEDAVEGITAFIEKRPPMFKGR